MSSEATNNKCEICGLQSIEGIIDSKNKVRYTCQDHVMKLYDKIAQEGNKK
jgi:hypothetical protein